MVSPLNELSGDSSSMKPTNILKLMFFCSDRFIQKIFYCLTHYCVTFGEDEASVLESTVNIFLMLE